jgi:hypothetical protein
MQPEFNCDGASIIDIGVFAHEFGHAFGLPDLYDTNGGFGKGVGRHALMGAGNWNRPANPTHMNAWSKIELGWIVPTIVGPFDQLYAINDVETHPEAYQLNVMREKFSRKAFNPIQGSFSFHCGLTSDEAAARGYLGGSGYGNGWHESIRRDFSYDGSFPVILQYTTSYDLESGYDYGRAKLVYNATEVLLNEHTGAGAASPTVDLTAYLLGSGATSYQIVFEFESDESWSDEDGNYNSGSAGPFKVDMVSVTGGGVAYLSNFEQHEDGWYYDFNRHPSREFFLVENKSKVNGTFDQHLFAEGLFIWHIEQNMAHTDLVNDENPNQDATSPKLPYAVALEEADGQFQLKRGASFGDVGDPYPGSKNNRTFDNNSVPSSETVDSIQTNVAVHAISDPGAQMTAIMRAGHFPPGVASISPAAGDQNETVTITEILGSGFVHGATFLLSGPVAASAQKSGAVMNSMRTSGAEYEAGTVEWVGKAKLAGTIDLTGVATGTYDVVVRNPDGQTATLAAAFVVNDPTPVFVQAFDANALDGRVELVWDIFADEPFRGFKLMRRAGLEPERAIHGDDLLATQRRRFVDDTVAPGVAYDYALVVVLGDGTEQRSIPASVRTPEVALQLFQNHPNPFNPITAIRFSLPKSARVQLTVYDLLGRPVVTLVNEVRPDGIGEVVWDGRSAGGNPVASGVYFYRLRTGKNVLTRKLVLLK